MLSGAAVVKTLVEGKELTVGSVVWIPAVVDATAETSVTVRVVGHGSPSDVRVPVWVVFAVPPAACWREPVL